MESNRTQTEFAFMEEMREKEIYNNKKEFGKVVGVFGSIIAGGVGLFYLMKDYDQITNYVSNLF